jgi:Na+-translocating ferredoxin:NAD+ oxidoreductase RnfA subunit
VRGDLHTTLTAPGISEILDFTFYPFGNAYIGNGPDVPCDALTCTVCLSRLHTYIYLYISIPYIHAILYLLLIDLLVQCVYTHIYVSYKLKLTTHHLMKRSRVFTRFITSPAAVQTVGMLVARPDLAGQPTAATAVQVLKQSALLVMPFIRLHVFIYMRACVS